MQTTMNGINIVMFQVHLGLDRGFVMLCIKDLKIKEATLIHQTTVHIKGDYQNNGKNDRNLPDK